MVEAGGVKGEGGGVEGKPNPNPKNLTKCHPGFDVQGPGVAYERRKNSRFYAV
jgi:hypothetical protein